MDADKDPGAGVRGPVLVTGGTGFLGAYILRSLVARGIPVRALRRAHSRLPFFLTEDVRQSVEWVEGDVLDVVSLRDTMQGVESLIHAAALVSFSKEDRSAMYAVNVEGTANVVNAALDAGVKRILHVSSVAALGRSRQEETVTEEKKWQPGGNHTHYAISKYQAEMHVWRGFAEGLDGVVINPSTILGFGDWHQSSCAIFRNAYREFPWYTEGVNGFVGVEDTAEAAVRLLLAPIHHRKFIVSAENRSFRDLFTAISQGFDKKPPHREASRLMGEIAWRIEGLRASFTGNKPLLTRETAKVAHSKTSFDAGNLLRALPDFRFTPLQTVIAGACEKYLKALQAGTLSL